MNELMVKISLASVFLAGAGWVIREQRSLRKFIEAMGGRLERRFNKRFDQMNKHFDGRFDRAERRADKHFDRCAEQISETKKAIDGVRSELSDRDAQLRTETTAHVSQLRRAMNRGFNAMHGRMSDLNARFSKVESVVEVLRDYLFGRARASGVRRADGTRVVAQGLPPKKVK